MTVMQESSGRWNSRSSETTKKLQQGDHSATQKRGPWNRGKQNAPKTDDDHWSDLGALRRSAAAPASTAEPLAGGGGSAGSTQPRSSTSTPVTPDPWLPWRSQRQKEKEATDKAPPSRSSAVPSRDGRSPATARWRGGGPRDGTASPGGADAVSTAAATPVELSPPSDAQAGSDVDKAGKSTDEVKTAPQAKASAKRAKGRGGVSKVEGLPRSVRISKTLTQILRHRALDLGVAIRADGYCRLKDVLAVSWLSELECTTEDVESVVKESDKKRFDMIEEDGESLIRAAQGHSIKTVEDECLLKRLTPEDDDLPEICVHGTYKRHYEKIRAGGLLAGGNHGQSFRKHVHFAPFNPWDRQVISGMRFDCEVAIWIDLKKALEDGLPFYVSANQVILSPGAEGRVDQRYFLKAQDLKTGQALDLSAPAPAPSTQQPRAKAKAASAH